MSNKQNIIYVDMPNFWINLKDPKKISTESPDNSDEWKPIQLSYCAIPYLIEEAAKGNIVYMMKKSITMGYVLKLESELFKNEAWKSVVKDSRFSPGQYQLRKQNLINRIRFIEKEMKNLKQLKKEAGMSYEEWLEYADGIK
jgi:hypothetical protein